jgi:hypothetical protein
VARRIEVKIAFINILRADSVQAVLAVIHFKVFCLAVCYLKR